MGTNTERSANGMAAFWSGATGYFAGAWNSQNFERAAEIAKKYSLSNTGLNAAANYNAAKFAFLGIVAGAGSNGTSGAVNASFASLLGFLAGRAAGPQVGTAIGAGSQFLLDEVSRLTREVNLGGNIYELQSAIESGQFWYDLENYGEPLFRELENLMTQLNSSIFDALTSSGEELGEWFSSTAVGSWLYENWINPATGNSSTVNPATNTHFNTAQSWVMPRRDPLALDLDGDGIETIGIGNWANTTLFDHDGDGVKDGTGWLSGDDGWLVRDLDGNGSIDSGAELFGENTVLANGNNATDGFSALADLDSNGDGKIDVNDAAFGELKVWQDANQDGISQAGELSTLSERGIAAIDLSATEVNANQNGTLLRSTTRCTRVDGSQGALGNWNLAEAA